MGITLSPLRGSDNLLRVSQGSQSLALGLALVAAPQLTLPLTVKDVMILNPKPRLLSSERCFAAASSGGPNRTITEFLHYSNSRLHEQADRNPTLLF